MKNLRLFLLLSGIFVVVAGFGWANTAKIISEDSCENQILSEITSPDRTYKAVKFQRDCGATTGFSTQISVLKNEEKLLNKGGNLFVADRAEANISWIDSRSLRLTYHSGVRVFVAKTSISDISVQYELLK